MVNILKVDLQIVYNVFNKVLNPTERLYNRYYPRGRYFYNVGVNYKWYKGKFVFSGETAVDKQGKIATLNQADLFTGCEYFLDSYQQIL